MEKYAWNFDKDDGIWEKGSFDTIEECISDAKDYIIVQAYRDIDGKIPKCIYIGENELFEDCCLIYNIKEYNLSLF